MSRNRPQWQLDRTGIMDALALLRKHNVRVHGCSGGFNYFQGDGTSFCTDALTVAAELFPTPKEERATLKQSPIPELKALEITSELIRQHTIDEVTKACKVFEKYKIKRITSTVDYSMYFSIENHAEKRFDDTATLCIYLTEDTIPRIKKLKETIDSAQTELNKLVGDLTI